RRDEDANGVIVQKYRIRAPSGGCGWTLNGASGQGENGPHFGTYRSNLRRFRPRLDCYHEKVFQIGSNRPMNPGLVSTSEGRQWLSSSREGTSGFRFQLNLIGEEYTDAYSVDLVQIDQG